MRFPNKVTIGAILTIRDLVKKQLRGAIQRPLIVASRHIPCHAGFPSIPSARLHFCARPVGGAVNPAMHLREPALPVLTSR